MLQKTKSLTNNIDNYKTTLSPIVEIVKFDSNDKEKSKETHPLSYFLDSECHKLKILNSVLN